MKTIHLLVGVHMNPIPKTITLVENYGDVFLHVAKNPLQKIEYHHGDHCIVQGEEKDIIEWLYKFDSVWIGKGHPMMQSFDLISYKEKK